MIHSTAIIEPGAELGKSVRVGAYCYIGNHVKLGDGCELRNGATLVGHTTVGRGCVFFTNCVIGEVPQDLKYKGTLTRTLIGEENCFREFVTVHAGTETGGALTRIGDHNLFCVGVHLAHDTCIGNHVVMANNVQLAGHVHVEDCVNMGGQTAVHHFVTIGRFAMLGGLSRIVNDVPPYMTTTGSPAEVRGANFEGLKRWGLSENDLTAISKAYKLLYSKRTHPELTFQQRLDLLSQENGSNEHSSYLYDFVKRTLSAGNSRRYLESLRRDTPEDRLAFYSKKEQVGEH